MDALRWTASVLFGSLFSAYHKTHAAIAVIPYVVLKSTHSSIHVAYHAGYSVLINTNVTMFVTALVVTKCPDSECVCRI